MSVVNFSIPPTLDDKIQKSIEEQGFSSKAEFFRFAAIYLMQNFQEETQKNEYNETMKILSKTLQKKFREKEMSSLEEQFSDL